MNLSAILLARTLAFVDINELNPRGAVSLPALVPTIVERFNFQKFPSKPEDFDEKKGVSFKEGYYNGQTIDELAIYSDGVKLDLRSSTTDGKRILVETFGWLAANHGIVYSEKMIRRWSYVSNIAFSSEVELDLINPAIEMLGRRISEELKDDGRVVGGFHFESIRLNVDQTFGARQISPFTIERRANIAFSEGKYFSASPLQTDVHISLLEEFDTAMRKQLKK